MPISQHDRDLSTVSVSEGSRAGFGMGEADRHFVDVGPAWKTKVPPFRVLVHSPSKRSSLLSGAYTVYTITSLFDVPNSQICSPSSSPHPATAQPLPSDVDDDESPHSPPSPVRITVHRRFSHFVVLHTALTRRLPGIALPPLPEKQYAGRFNDDFVEARRGDLERYLSRVVRHPVARYAEVLTFFLGCESDIVRTIMKSSHMRAKFRHLGVEEATPSVPVSTPCWTRFLRSRVPSCIQSGRRRRYRRCEQIRIPYTCRRQRCPRTEEYVLQCSRSVHWCVSSYSSCVQRSH